MNNHNTLFYNIMKFIRVMHTSFHDLRILQTFAWAIVGVIQSEQPHFSHWLPYRDGQAKAASKERQFSRWLHNKKIDPMRIYQGFIKTMLSTWGGETIYVALDTTQLWREFVIVRLALIYCGRALPLGWVVYRSGSATVAVEQYKTIIVQVAAQIPAATTVILLAARGFGHIDLMKLATQLPIWYPMMTKLSVT